MILAIDGNIDTNHLTEFDTKSLGQGANEETMLVKKDINVVLN